MSQTILKKKTQYKAVIADEKRLLSQIYNGGQTGLLRKKNLQNLFALP